MNSQVRPFHTRRHSMKLKSLLALAAVPLAGCAVRPRGAAAGRQQERDPDRHDPGPVGPAGRLRQAGAQRHAAARRRDSTSRAASTAASSSCWSRTTATTRRRPCWPRRSWSTRTRSSSWSATSARRRTWRRCRCSSRRTSSTSSRSPRRARCTSRCNRLKYSFAATYYDQMRTSAAQAGQGKGREEGLHDLPGRRLRPGSAARRRGRPEDHRTWS